MYCVQLFAPTSVFGRMTACHWIGQEWTLEKTQSISFRCQMSLQMSLTIVQSRTSFPTLQTVEISKVEQIGDSGRYRPVEFFRIQALFVTKVVRLVIGTFQIIPMRFHFVGFGKGLNSYL